ncbi:MAG TPA: hypothetical protein VFP12_02845 [Allosphingosinicella sp.]|nr:hypothetical protein [Allosphingosinicella sp.]
MRKAGSPSARSSRAAAKSSRRGGTAGYSSAIRSRTARWTAFAAPAAIVILENRNFGGNEDFLRANGVAVAIVDDRRCIDLMARFIAERPELWHEDIGEA